MTDTKCLSLEEAQTLVEKQPHQWLKVWTLILTHPEPMEALAFLALLTPLAGKTFQKEDGSPVSGPRTIEILEVYVTYLRERLGTQWFQALWSQTPSKTIGREGWYKLGDGGVPYALLHKPGICIYRSGEVEAEGPCPNLPSLIIPRDIPLQSTLKKIPSPFERLFKPIVHWSDQPPGNPTPFRLACGGWATLAQGEERRKTTMADVYRTENEELFTFVMDKVTCPQCGERIKQICG
jgi:hypothetical protein